MRKQILLAAILAATGITAFVACTGTNANEKKAAHVMSNAEMVKRGEYLVSIIGCDDCHSPKKIGPHGLELIPELRLSGYPSDRPIQNADSNVVKQGWAMFGGDFTSAAGPWGMSFAANITSDATGIGNWKEEQFIKAIREGKYKGLDGTRPLLEPMPWFVYMNMTDDDLKSIFAYLKTTKPVKNIVPSPKTFADLK
jgi:hypothetical protein